VTTLPGIGQNLGSLAGAAGSGSAVSTGQSGRHAGTWSNTLTSSTAIRVMFPM